MNNNTLEVQHPSICIWKWSLLLILLFVYEGIGSKIQNQVSPETAPL